MARECEDWLNSYIRLTDIHEPPELFRRWVGIGVIAAAMQRKCYLPWGEDLTIYPNLFVVLTAPPGKARKTLAIRQGRRFLRDDMLGVKIAPDKTSPEQLLKDLANSIQTSTAADKKINTHCSLTVFSGELTVFLGNNNLQFLTELTDLYDCADNWEYRTKHMGTDKVYGVWLNLIGGTTPKLIQTSLPLEALGGGLTSRVIFVYADRKGKTAPLPFETPELSTLRLNLERDLVEISAISGQYKVSEKLLKTYHDWYLAFDNGEIKPSFYDERFDYYFERKPTTARKLALILAASSRNELIVNEGDFLRALSLLDEVEGPMARALSGVGRSNYAEMLPRVMREVFSRKECTYDYLMRKFRQDLTKQDLDNLLITMEKMKYCDYIETSGKIRFNPEFDKLSAEDNVQPTNDS